MCSVHLVILNLALFRADILACNPLILAPLAVLSSPGSHQVASLVEFDSFPFFPFLFFLSSFHHLNSVLTLSCSAASASATESYVVHRPPARPQEDQDGPGRLPLQPRPRHQAVQDPVPPGQVQEGRVFFCRTEEAGGD